MAWISKAGSWHNKYFLWLMDNQTQDVTVCSYWGNIVFFSVLAVFFSWMIPVIWCGEKADEWLARRRKGKPLKQKRALCPFGKVKFD